MLPEIEKLLILQASDQQIRALKLELGAVPEQKTVREKACATTHQTFHLIKTRLREIELEKKSLELDIQSKSESIARYKHHQLQTRKNEEYSALGHEINTAENKIRSIEDRELELMEEAEQLHPKFKKAEQEYSDGQSMLQTQLSGLETRQNSLKTRIQALEAERLHLREGIEENLLDEYTRLFRTKNGPVVVPLDREFCSGCHMTVTAQTIILVKAAQMVTRCPQCGRILYMD